MEARPNQKTSIEVFAEKLDGPMALVTGQGDGAMHIIGEVSYHKGGMNYFTGNHSKRGYRIKVYVEERGTSYRAFVIGDNLGQGEFLLEAHAFNAKKLEALATDPMVLSKLDSLKAIVLPLYRARQAAKQQAKELQAV